MNIGIKNVKEVVLKKKTKHYIFQKVTVEFFFLTQQRKKTVMR